MFNRNKKKLVSSTNKKTSAFLQAARKHTTKTRSENGALKYSTTDNPFVDQFTLIGSYKEPRKFEQIAKDCETLWASDRELAIKFIFYLRTINRKVQYGDNTTKEPQKGGELKHEAIMRMLWLSQKSPKNFYDNLYWFVVLGSVKDIFEFLRYDVNIIGKYLINRMYSEYREASDRQKGKYYAMYRRLKSSGTAHDWQQLISQQRFSELDFNSIHGRALSQLVRSKFLKNQGLQDRYERWITNPETKEVKHTGFVHELFQDYDNALLTWNGGRWQRELPPLVEVPKHVQETINKQFMTAVNKAGEQKITKLITVWDKKSTLLNWGDGTPMEKWFNNNPNEFANTNFQSVIDLFVDLRKQGIAEHEFPQGILCVSDSEFDPTQLNETNVAAAKQKLAKVFSKEYVNAFVIVLWNLQSTGRGNKFETQATAPNTFYFGGYSGSVISFLTNEIETPWELFQNAMDQEILNLLNT